MFGFLDKNKGKILAPVTGEMIDLATVSDKTFASKVLGDGVAFTATGSKVTVYAPCSGKLESLFPTGHAFGLQTPEGVEILVHIGVNTVEANGEGFRLLDKQQGDKVKAGDPIVEFDQDFLSKTYDMPIMFVVLNTNEKAIHFDSFGTVEANAQIGSIA